MKKQNILSIAICALLLLTSVTFYSAASETLSEVEKQLQKYDLNGDRAIDISDVTALLGYLAGNCGHVEAALPDKDPTCTEPGSRGGTHCALCKQIIKAPESIPSSGHNTVIDKGVEPTCKETGLTEGSHCDKCGTVFAVQEVLPASGHNTVIDKGVEPTCKETGLTEGSHCDKCGTVFDAQEVLPAGKHSYGENDLCTVCGQERASEGLEFTLSEDGSYYILTGIGDCRDKKVVIPALYLEKPVKEIAESAFEELSGVEEVIVPDSVTVIGEAAFASCPDLKKVTLSKNVTTLSRYLFSECPALETVVLPEGLLSVESYAFSGCTALENISLPSGIESIGLRAFEDCVKITSLTLHEGLTTIERGAFSGCTGLTDLVLPASLSTVKASVFSDCENLATIFLLTDSLPEGWLSTWISGCEATVFFKNQWSYVNGIPTPFTHEHLYETLPFVAPTCDSTGLTAGSYCPICKVILVAQEVIPATGHTLKDGVCIHCGTVAESTGLTFDRPAGEKYYTVTGIGSCTDSVIVIPKYYQNVPVRYIADYAFEGCTQITAVVLNSNILSIGDFAFYQCENLTTAVFNNGLLTIGDGAFAESGLTEAYLPEGLTSIGSVCFCDCKDLTFVNIPATLSTIPMGAFGNCSALSGIALTDSIKTVGFGAFEGCTALESISMAGVTSISSRAFFGCTSLKSVTLNEGLLTIDTLAFKGCTALEELLLPTSVESIAQNAFENCSSLKEIYIPEATATIGKGVFNGCTKLSAIYCEVTAKPDGWNDLWLGNSTPTAYYKGSWNYIGGKPHVHTVTALPGVPPTCTEGGLTEGSHCAICEKIYVAQKELPALGGSHSFNEQGVCTRCGDDEPISYTFAAGVLTVSGKGAVLPDEEGAYPWDALREQIVSVVIGDNVTEIGRDAFSHCVNLEEITFGASASVFRQDALAYCPKLATIFFGATVKTLEQGVVWGSDALADITLTGQKKDELLAIAKASAYNDSFESDSIRWHTNCDHNTVIDAAKSPTCNDTGLTEGAHCSVCGDVLVGQTVVPALGHSYDEASDCIRCGADEPITWTLEDGIFTIRGKGAILPEDPESITYPWNAQKSMIREIIVTGGITEIGARAFSNCTALEKATFGRHVTKVNNDILSYCDKLTEIVFNGTITYIGQGTVWGSESITDVTITEQSVASFLALAAVHPYNTPYTASSVSFTVNCAHSEVVTDPALNATCTDIGLSAGTHCAKCDTVLTAQQILPALGGSHSFVGGNCTECGISNGYSWEISGGTLYIRGAGAVTASAEASYPWHSRRAEFTAVVVGDGITEIGPWAFTRCTAVASITFGKNVKKLGQDVMSYCGALKEVVFNGPVTEIGQGIVWGSGNIEKVTVTGQTKDQFLAVATTRQYNDNLAKESIVWTVK